MTPVHEIVVGAVAFAVDQDPRGRGEANGTAGVLGDLELEFIRLAGQ